MILVILTGKLFFNLIKETSKNYTVALVGSCYLICNFSVIKKIMDLSFVAKYLFPLIILTYGLLLIKKGIHKNFSHSVILIFLVIFSIMNHEGSFVFPIVFILFDFLLYKKMRKQFFFLLLPSIVYSFARLFYFGVPSEGFMEVNWRALMDYVPKYMDYILVPYRLAKNMNAVEWLPHFSMCFFVVTLFLCIGFVNKKHYLKIFSLFSLIIILLMPFAVLINHFYWDRSLWAIIPTVLLISFIIENVQKRKMKLFLYGVFFIWFLIFGYSNLFKIKWEKKRIYSKIKNRKELKLTIQQQLTENISSVVYIDPKEVPHLWEHKLFAGFLSLNFPKKTFIIKHFNEHSQFFIQNGVIFISGKQGQWMDVFNYKSTLEWPERTKTIYINSKILKNLYF